MYFPILNSNEQVVIFFPREARTQQARPWTAAGPQEI
jgi:hypothetical protein